MYDILIIGGGASGLTAAISACRSNPTASVVVIERNNRVGKKLLTTGNGRCNISNANIDCSRFHSNNIDVVNSVLHNSGGMVEDFFASLGVPFIAEGDKLYPYSLQSAAVLDVLRYECERLNVGFVCECKVKEIKKGFIVVTDKGEFKAKKVIVACGGNAMQSSGSDGNGVKLLAKLGIKHSKTAPAIVPVKTELAPIKALKGVKVDGMLTLTDGKQSLYNRDEVLFTEYGISGPAVMQISRFINFTDKQVSACVDFLPDMSLDKLVDYLLQRKNIVYNNVAENLTLGLLHKRVGQAIIKYCRLNVNDEASNYTVDDINNIASAIKNFTVKVISTCGYESAQTTAGGVYLDQIDPSTFEFKSVKGLYGCGEVLDCDGDCGGFNLHWAWISGLTAGKSAAAEV